MSTTTQILFNSPALHSLKRDQLVKLCKIHGIKANGKSVDLIARLKQHAQDLPAQTDNDPTMQDDSEDTDQDVAGTASSSRAPPRPSEQWEMVMEDIAEVDEASTMGTLSSMRTLNQQSSTGEFGSSNSKNSVTTSLKALANSLGLKRAISKSNSNSSTSELDQHAVPYSSIPESDSLPRTDADGDTSMDAPIPGGPSRPGAPALPNARLSMGEGLTTTVRLISAKPRRETMFSPPRLPTFKPELDLIMSPGPGKVNVWPPASPEPQGRIYPSLAEMMSADHGAYPSNAFASPAPALSAAKRASLALPSDQPEDIFSPKKTPAAAPPSAARASIPRSEPFLFGSPLPANRPRTSNADFEKAAASVLSEMNKRLAESGVQGLQTDVFNKKIPASTDVFGGPLDATRQRTDSTADRFAKAHDDAFAKMDSIATHYAARRGTAAASSSAGQPQSKKRKSEAAGLGPAPGPSKRKSSAANARVISAGGRKKMGIPGGFGDDEDLSDDEQRGQEVEEAGDRRSSKRIRVTEDSDVHKGGRRVSLLVTVKGGGDETEEDRAREERKREAMKKKLDESRARRRSSRGRASVGGRAVPMKPKASRFGFLSSAKSLVRNVWNMGAGGGGATKQASSIPVPKTSAPVKPAPPPPQPAHAPAALAQPTSKVSSLGLGKPSTSRLSANRAPSGGAPSMLSVDTTGTRKSSSSRARSPIPSFNAPAQNSEHKPRADSTSNTASRIPSRTTSFSSMGTRTSLNTGSSAASSMGTKRSLATPAAGTSGSRNRLDSTDSKIPPVPRRPSSTLLAPTASSLAKRQSIIRNLPPPPRSPSTLQQITNSPQSPRQNPTPGKIFTTPLTGFGSPTSIPTPVQKPSFTAAGTSLFNAGAGAGPSSSHANAPNPIPPKPKTLIARKPRISRSRVIAKLGAQRAQATDAGSTPGKPSSSSSKARTRSSMGTAAARRSFGGVKAGRMSAGADLIAAKKRVRQSEIAARRKSRVARMEVDS
ncbi:hypothetical protein BXZ70DRAFT_1063578 [Cristinia sonorae]|uniref:SAP domain-containing protein n=1 Tax=Cristinia sonorae TaxID=1940300 RepID=A0A8K0USB4_9AGAR|nr:hypothetical protein BXZ70DRAFT_1063578 [Cristinia sonorae]